MVADSISVVHITDDGMTVIKPREITDTHVVVDTPHLSAYGIVWDLIKRFKDFMTTPINAQILLFLRSLYRGGQLILSVILLPGNVPLQEVKHRSLPSVQILTCKSDSVLIISTEGLYIICSLSALLWRVTVMSSYI